MTQEELEKLQILDQLRIYEHEKLVQHSEEAKAYIEKLAQNERRKLWIKITDMNLSTGIKELN